MRVFIAGIDGYLGWALTLYLSARGHEVGGCDNYLRRKCVAEMKCDSAIPILSMEERLETLKEKSGKEVFFREGDLLDYDFTEKCLKDFKPEAIVHLGEIPSAPYSMVDVKHAVFTQENNILSNLNLMFAMRDVCPEAQLVKLGTMGEYGTPNIDIPEGFFEIEYRGRKDRLPFPRQPGSWYHLTKVHDTFNVMFACRIWGLCSTDIMQGVVFGTQIDEMEGDPRLATRFDFDESFGTAINRFCAQAVIGEPLTPFGAGHQKRGFLPMRDSMQCLTLAITNPPKKGEYRVFNQFEEVYDITQLCEMVKEVGGGLGLDVEVRNIENPRMENEDHRYVPDHQHLLDLGYIPTRDIKGEMKIMIEDLIKNKDRIEEYKDTLTPEIRWDGTRKKVDYLK